MEFLGVRTRESEMERMPGVCSSMTLGAAGARTINTTIMKLVETDHSSMNWYFPREEIERSSPSRKDGIDLKKENYLRKSFCTFLQDLGMKLKLPQLTIATAIVFCHRFFLRQSHHKNDHFMIATICMFIAGKAEDTPRSLRDVILVSFESRFKKDPAAVHRIKQKDVYDAEKERVLLGERLVLTTLGFDLNIHHPYKPLATAVSKFPTDRLGVSNPQLAQVAWNFLNDGLRTSLCLQYKPHHIAAGALFLAAKFLKVKLPSEGDSGWWQPFEVNPRQLEDVSNQMLSLYEQNKAGTSSRMSDPSSSAGPSGRAKLMPSPQAPPPVKVHPNDTENKMPKVMGAEEITEARSSLEEGQDTTESRLAPLAMQITGKSLIESKMKADVEASGLRREARVVMEQQKSAIAQQHGVLVDALPTKACFTEEEQPLRQVGNGVEASVRVEARKHETFPMKIIVKGSAGHEHVLAGSKMVISHNVTSERFLSKPNGEFRVKGDSGHGVEEGEIVRSSIGNSSRVETKSIGNSRLWLDLVAKAERPEGEILVRNNVSNYRVENGHLVLGKQDPQAKSSQELGTLEFEKLQDQEPVVASKRKRGFPGEETDGKRMKSEEQIGSNQATELWHSRSQGFVIEGEPLTYKQIPEPPRSPLQSFEKMPRALPGHSERPPKPSGVLNTVPGPRFPVEPPPQREEFWVGSHAGPSQSLFKDNHPAPHPLYSQNSAPS